MDLMDAMNRRHSVRQYQDKLLSPEALSTLRAEVEDCNRDSGLHIQLVTGEPKAFDGLMAHYGKFQGVTHYFALIGPKGAGQEEACGYYGERLVLRAQQLRLNTCWVAMTYRKVKSAFTIGPGEKLHAVIALGYGATQGVPHRSKTPEEISKAPGSPPDWFRAGVEAALLAPTALNQQKFTFTLQGDRVAARAGAGFYTKMDLGIAKYHFELGSGRGPSVWV